MEFIKKNWLWILLIVAVAGGAYWWWSMKKDHDADKVIATPGNDPIAAAVDPDTISPSAAGGIVGSDPDGIA